MGFVAQRVQVMALGYALVEAKQELARVQQEHARLTVEVARSRSLERVEHLARTRLGMVDAEPAAAVIVMTHDGAALVAAEPAGAHLRSVVTLGGLRRLAARPLQQHGGSRRSLAGR